MAASSEKPPVAMANYTNEYKNPTHLASDSTYIGNNSNEVYYIWDLASYIRLILKKQIFILNEIKITNKISFSH